MKQNKNQNVVIPAATAAMLRQMFTSCDGVDMTAIIKDLGANSNEDLAAINLGLLFNGYTLEVPERTYRVETGRDGNPRRVYVYVKSAHSVLKDIVAYIQYCFEPVTDDEGNVSWTQDSYAPSDTATIEYWFKRDIELPEGIVLPEIVEKD